MFSSYMAVHLEPVSYLIHYYIPQKVFVIQFAMP